MDVILSSCFAWAREEEHLWSVWEGVAEGHLTKRCGRGQKTLALQGLGWAVKVAGDVEAVVVDVVQVAIWEGPSSLAGAVWVALQAYWR